VLALLAKLGSGFDTASVPEIVSGARCQRDARPNLLWQYHQKGAISRARLRSAGLFAVDCQAEVEKIARAAPGSRVFCRILSDCVGAEWPLSRKFGCEPPWRRTFWTMRFGSDSNPMGYRSTSDRNSATRTPGTGRWHRPQACFRDCADRGISLQMVNLAAASRQVPQERATVKSYGAPRSSGALRRHFGKPHPGNHHRAGPRHGGQCGHDRGRGRARLQEERERRRALVYLDIGKFGGLAETMDESIRYPIRTPRTAMLSRPASWRARPAIRPNVMYEKETYPLPVSLEIGDKVLIEGTGAYTATYAAVASMALRR